MNRIDRGIADRDTLIMGLVGVDCHAIAALVRGDDLALLRRIGKVPSIAGARELAIERALMRGYGYLEMRRALGVMSPELQLNVAHVYGRM